MQWWHWGLLGLFLLFVEFATPGALFALFFGISALIVAALLGTGLIAAPWIQWALFSGVAVLAVFLLRQPLRAGLARGAVPRAVDSLVGETAVVLEDVEAAGTGRVQLRGSPWAARNAGTEGLRKGRRCRVERVEGLTLWVRAD
jgi:inner membrane protein